jgi:lipopolysaccharide/colanic/teichoic acid biosynthesis glycosyltransferase
METQAFKEMRNLQALNLFRRTHLQIYQLIIGRVAQQWPTLVKRLVDIFLSTLLALLFLPLMMAVSLLIKLSSPGPILFTQVRIGYRGRRFKMYKYRTMITDAENRIGEIEHLNEVSGPVFKMKHDPRVTAVGRFLRRSSLDELPQLFNVLKGEMSLVGPRPLSERDYEKLGRDSYLLRFTVQPGLTCLWQIKGRSLIPFEQWMNLDAQYVRQRTLWLDLKILLRTIPAVLRATGAA